MAIFANYSPEDVTVLFAGVHKLSGFVERTFISISKDEIPFTTHVSADGKVSRRYQKDGIYSVRAILASTSESNEVLSYAHRMDELTRMAKFPLIIKDQMGSSLFFSAASWVETIPQSDFSTEVESREWVIKCFPATFVVGGNESPTGMGEDALNALLGISGGAF